MPRIWDDSSTVIGLESYYMDGDINIDVNTTGGDVSDDAVEAEDMGADAVVANDEAAAVSGDMEEQEKADDTVDMLMRRAAVCYNYIGKYGITNDLLYLQNYDKFLARHTDLRRLGTESFGNPRNGAAYAAMEDLAGAAKGVWEWIKKMCRKIVDWLKEMWARVMRIFESQKNQIQRLKGMLNSRKDIDFTDKTVPSIKVVDSETLVNEVKALATNGSDTAGNALTQFALKDDSVEYSSDQHSGTEEKEYDGFVSKLDDLKSKIEDYSIEWDTKEVDGACGNARTCLNNADAALETHKLVDKEQTNLGRLAKNVEKEADKLEKEAGTESWSIVPFMLDGNSGSELTISGPAIQNTASGTATAGEDKNKNKKPALTDAQKAEKKALAAGLRRTVKLINKRADICGKKAGLIKKCVAACITSASRYIAKGTVTKS